MLKYLYKTKDLNLTFDCNLNSHEILDCFVDWDWAGDSINRKSISGYLIRFYGTLIYWKTHKQGIVTKSSTFLEYVALSEAVTEALVIKDLLAEFEIKINKPVSIYEDNSGAIAIAKNGNLTKNSRNIEIHYHYVHESYLKNEIDVIKVDTKDNLADILTKALSKEEFIKFRKLLKIK